MYGNSGHRKGNSFLKLQNTNFFMPHGKTPAEFFGTFEYVHKKLGRHRADAQRPRPDRRLTRGWKDVRAGSWRFWIAGEVEVVGDR
jgi:hypothetical protein